MTILFFSRMNPLPVMTQIFIKGLFSHRSAITNGTEGCQEMAETAQNNFPLEFNFVFCFSSRSLGSGILMELLSPAAPRGPWQGWEDRAMTASMWVIWLSSGRSRLSPPMCQISCGMTRWAAGAEARAFSLAKRHSDNTQFGAL